MIMHTHLHRFLELGLDASSLYFLFSECILYLSYTIKYEENMFYILMLKLINYSSIYVFYCIAKSQACSILNSGITIMNL